MAVDPGKVAEGGEVVEGQAEDASAQPQESRSGGVVDWLRSTFFGGGGGDQPDGADDGASEGGAESDRGQAATDGANQADAETVTISKAELQRRIDQSARDRLAAMQRANETRAQRAERLRLAREEPYKLADQVEQELTAAEQAESFQAQFVQSLTPVLQIVDAEVVGAVVQALPDEARQKLFDEMPADLAGVAQRSHIVKSGLAELERHWRAEGAKEAEAKLRRNGTIVKQVLAEQRATEEEPDLIPAAGVPRRTDMDSILRDAFGVS